MVTTRESSTDELTELASRLRLTITRTARRLRQQGGTDLSPSQMSALATVEKCGPVTPSELADHERVKRPTATRIVARLAEQGLVSRAADPGDRRSSLVSISPEGKALLGKLRGRKNAYLARRLRELDADEISALERAAYVLEHLLESERRT